MSEQLAVVTGANRGIGREVAAQLAEHGFTVILCARSGEEAGKAAGELASHGIILPFACDIRDTATIEDLARWIGERWGSLDVLVNNAGVFSKSDGNALEISTEIVKETFDTNTLGALRMTQALAKFLLAAKGNVVNVSSGMGALTDMAGGYLGYRMSKASLNVLTKVLHAEMNPQGVRVNAVCPGWVQTDMGGESAPRTVDIGARSVVWAAVLGPDGPSGGFFRDGQAIAW